MAVVAHLVERADAPGKNFTGSTVAETIA